MPQIASLSIDGLFRLFDHKIPLNTQERVTLIHGPNGVGKTTILRMIASLFARNFSVLRRIPFESLSVVFSDGSRLRVKREVGDQPPKASRPSVAPDLSFEYWGESGEHHQLKLSPLPEKGRLLPLGMIEHEIDELERVGELEWLETSTGDVLALEQVLDRYGDVLPVPPDLLSSRSPPWLVSLLETVPILFIETQRLFYRASPVQRPIRLRQAPQMGPAISAFSTDLAEEIQGHLAQSASTSQELDRTFPSRLLKQRKLPNKASPEEIRRRYEKQTALRGRLMRAGLLDSAEGLALPARTLDQMERRVLWTYLNDVDKKLAVFDRILERIELFKDIINAKFLNKAMSVDKSLGYLFRASDGTVLAPADLSSGEQHETVLAYQLLFKVKAGSLILIDEPEISLHVSWQHQFLPDLTRISGLADLDFLIATHSPQIIFKRWDLAVDLEAPSR